ncbi:alkaline phosphatase family protein [Halobaculum limi]|uniref:alkaline phosphatase family protein n=1 Tax=Halobaculum limi TaxID=3031916 RepID=UPI00240702D9|nr:alkaline phosphatase family protein [Halobaculum sp. YSMS11]
MSDDDADRAGSDPLADPTLPGMRRDGYVFPDYENYCFANVPGTVADVLGVESGRRLPDDAVPSGDYSTVLVVLVDGFGLDQFRTRRASIPLLDSLATAGTSTPLTSVYPSETAAAITSVHTGATPAEHGLLGWNLRLRDHDLTCESLPFLAREGGDLGEATSGEVTGDDLFDADPVYRDLSAAGVDSHVVQHTSIADGPYSEAATAGATVHGVESLPDLAVTARRQVETTDEPTYVYAYWSDVDSTSHARGTDSDRYRAELETACATIERELARIDPSAAEDTLVVLTADHGHLNADPAAAVDLESYPEVWNARDHHRTGKPVLPTGGPRNVHLHLRDGASVQRARETLVEASFDARVLTGTEALEAGLFGPGEPSDLLRARVGDLVVVPRDRDVWFAGEQRKLDFVGTHGGQSPEEMYVPFLAADLETWQASRTA